MVRVPVIAAIAVCMSAAAPAVAQPGAGPSNVAPVPPLPDAGPVEPDERNRTVRIEGQLGLGMPLGGAGLEASFLATSGLSISAGFGTSIHGDTQLAFMPRLHLFAISRTAYLSVGAGLSYGDYEEIDLFGDGDIYPAAVWGNLEASIAIYVRAIGLRAFSGYSRILTHGETATATSGRVELPYLGLGLSASF
jgi:hypothetical protein